MLLSDLVGYIAQVLVVFFLTIEALNLLHLEFLVRMLTAITAYLPMVLAAVIILALGLMVANIVSKILSNILTGP
ncbi:mechanosensitive ion channel family protein, partial [Staphylococcus epidermidis]